MDNATRLQALSQLSPDGWDYHCVTLLPDFATVVGVFVDSSGNPMPQFNNQTTWGITRAACLQYCNSDVIPIAMDFNFQDFATAFTAYLLPWLGLIAQLPTETGGPFGNLMSICMAIGSPAMITYSLAITILNRYWVRKQFRRRRDNLREMDGKYDTFGDRLRYIQYFLEEAQQVPLRASQEDGWFSSLVVAGPNHVWWENVEDRLIRTRRWKTLSFIFQMIVAVIAWLFTVIAAFVSSLGDISTALQISSGSIWIWMIPVLWGWILVGSQFRSDSIDEAIGADTAFKALQPPFATRHGAPSQRIYSNRGRQKGLVVVESGFGLTPKPNRRSPLASVPEDDGDFFSIRGDERKRGPMYNYARIFTYCQLIETMNRSLTVMMNNIRDRRRCSGTQDWQGNDYEEQLSGDAAATDSYCGLDPNPNNNIYAYPEWSDIPQRIRKGIFVAAAIALIVQWGTTGPAIMIAYLTPLVGLGCRSGGYLLYGTMATLTWASLVLSMIFSHEAMLQVQRSYQKNPSAPATNGSIPMNNLNHQQHRNTMSLTTPAISSPNTFSFRLVSTLAILTRGFGKTLAVLNTAFIITISLFEYVGGFSNCWCKSDTPGRGASGWIVMFKSAHELSQAASTPWAMGVMLSILVCVASLAFFYMGTAEAEARFGL